VNAVHTRLIFSGVFDPVNVLFLMRVKECIECGCGVRIFGQGLLEISRHDDHSGFSVFLDGDIDGVPDIFPDTLSIVAENSFFLFTDLLP